MMPESGKGLRFCPAANTAIAPAWYLFVSHLESAVIAELIGFVLRNFPAFLLLIALPPRPI